MVTRWTVTVDQEVVGSNPIHDIIKFLSCTRSSGLLSPFSKMSTGFWWQGSSTALGLKIWIYVPCWFAVVSHCTGSWVENDTPPARHKQYTHGHRICPPRRTTLLWLHGLCTPCRARCEKQKKSHVITWARIRQVLTPWEVVQLPTSLPDCHRLLDYKPSTAGEYTPGLDPRVSRAGYNL